MRSVVRSRVALVVLSILAAAVLAQRTAAQDVAVAPAAAPTRAVLAELEASSTLGRGARHAIWRAFDADVTTAWCPTASEAASGSTVSVRFAEPVTLRSLVVSGAGHAPGDDDPATFALTVTSDAGVVTAEVEASPENPSSVAMPAGTTRSLTFHLAGHAAVPGQALAGCLADIQIELEDRAMLYGVPPEALGSIEGAIAELDRALVDCDFVELTRMARFPVGFRETGMGERREYTTGPGSDSDPAAFPRARSLPCSWAASRPDDHGTRSAPILDAGIAPGIVRVMAGFAIARVYWELAWRRGRWQLVSIDTVFFE